MLPGHSRSVRRGREPHPRLRRSTGDPLPSEVHRLGRWYGNRSHRPGFQQSRRKGAGAGKRFQRSGEIARSTIHIHDDLALQRRERNLGRIEVVILRLGQVQAISDKHQRRIHMLQLRRARTQYSVRAQHQWLGLATCDQADGGLVRQHPLHIEMHRLIEPAIDACRLQSVGLELVHNIGRCLKILGAARHPPAHRVVRQITHMCPPNLAPRLVRSVATRRSSGSGGVCGLRESPQGNQRQYDCGNPHNRAQFQGHSPGEACSCNLSRCAFSILGPPRCQPLPIIAANLTPSDGLHLFFACPIK